MLPTQIPYRKGSQSIHLVDTHLNTHIYTELRVNSLIPHSFHFFIFYQSIVVVPISAIQQNDSIIYTFFFKNYFPSRSIPRDRIQFLVLHSRTLLVIYSKSNSLNLLIPNSQSTPLPPPPIW